MWRKKRGGGAPLAGDLSEARQEVCDSHGGGGPVALLHAAVLAQGDIEALVNKRLVGIVVVRQQSLPELALVHEGPLQHRKPEGRGAGWKEVSKGRGNGGLDERDAARTPDFRMTFNSGTWLSFKACSTGNRRRWHVTAERNTDTAPASLSLRLFNRTVQQSAKSTFHKWRTKE